MEVAPEVEAPVESGRAMDWRAYIKQVAKEEGLTYSQAMVAASKSWPAYKEVHGIKAAPKKKPAPKAVPAKTVSSESAESADKPKPKARAPRKTKAQQKKEAFDLMALKLELIAVKEELAACKAELAKK